MPPSHPQPLPTVDFARIRPHDGRQDRAWEELAYMLARGSKEVPASTKWERRGTPDGGIEFSCTFADADRTERWAWQAKYLFKLDSSELAQLTGSFKDALANWPGITKYIFVLPINRPAGRLGNSALKKWYEYVSEWQELAAAAGTTVEIEYEGESEILLALQQERYACAIRYFFDSTFLTQSTYETVVGRAIDNLGDRYERDADVGSNIDDVLDALGLHPRFVQRLRRLGVEASDRARTSANLLQRAGVDSQSLTELSDVFSQVHNESVALASDGVPPKVAAINDAASDLRGCVETMINEAAHLPDKPVPPERDDSPAYMPTRDEVLRGLYRTADVIRDLIAVVNGQAGRAATKGVMLLVGAAGSGKSHTLAAHCEGRVTEGFPTLLALGQNLTANSSIWDELLASMELGYQYNDLLEGMKVAAAVGRSGRALIIVDAVNEGAGQDLWKSRVTGFANEISRHERLGLVLSVRDTYEDSVLPLEFRESAVRVLHPGITGREAEAVQLYAARYGLQLPETPTYHPEFSNPLLLKSVCRAARGNGLSILPALSRGQAWIFEGLLRDVNETVSSAQRLDRDPEEQIVQHALQQFAAVMLDGGTEALEFSHAKQICSAIHSDGGKHSKGLLPALIAEGLLLRERYQDGDRVRITFQRLTDFLRARELLGRTAGPHELGQLLGRKLASHRGWQWHGIAAALTALAPDQYGSEVIDLVRAGFPDDVEEFDWSTENILGQALLESLTWRQPSSITDRTVDLVREYVANGYLEPEDWIGALLTLSCIPDHPLNVDYLSARLLELSDVERHFAWAVVVANIWLTDPNPAARIIDWLWDADRTVTGDTRRLAAKLMTWFLGVTVRRLRDSATKVLVQLLDGATPELTLLLRAFEKIDDWYIVERLLAVAYGHVTRVPRHAHADGHLVELAEAIVGIATSSTTTHALIRHYASATLTRISDLVGTSEGIPSMVFPAGAWPLQAESVAELSERLGRPDKKYLIGTPMGYDFREKLIGRSVAHDFIPPDQGLLIARRRANARRRFKRAFERLQQLLGPEQRADELIGRLVEVNDLPWRQRQRAKTAILDALPGGSAELIAKLEESARISSSTEPVRLDADLLERWLTERALELGWVPESAGGPSESADQRRHGEDKVETLGKKYIWIAFYELMGVLTDHCLIQEFSAPAEQYRHPWQLPSGDDIDPTVTLRGDSPPPDSTSARLLARSRSKNNENWWRTQHRSPLRKDVPEDGAWLRDSSDLPVLENVLSCVDPTGQRWLVLESHSSWERHKNDGRREPHRHDMWTRNQAYLIHARDLADIKAWAPGQNWMGLWMPTPPDHGPGWFRDYPREAAWSEWIDLVDKERRYDRAEILLPGWQKPTGHAFPSVPITLVTHGSTLHASRDYSSADLPRPRLPSPLLLTLLRAELGTPTSKMAKRLGLGPVEREYSWESDGEIVMFATDGWGWAGGSSLLVRAAALNAALRNAGLACWAWVLGEKINWIQGEPTSKRMDILGAAELAETVNPWGVSFKADE